MKAARLLTCEMSSPPEVVEQPRQELLLEDGEAVLCHREGEVWVPGRVHGRAEKLRPAPRLGDRLAIVSLRELPGRSSRTLEHLARDAQARPVEVGPHAERR